MRHVVGYNCADCGTPVKRKRDRGQPLVCPQCGQARYITNAMGLHKRSPDQLRQWGWGMVRAGLAALAEADLTDPPPLDKPRRHTDVMPGMRSAAPSRRRRINELAARGIEGK